MLVMFADIVNIVKTKKETMTTCPEATPRSS
jgi:hypothetical protein